MRNRYAPFERLVTPARPSSELWRLIFGLVAIGFLYVTLTQAIYALLRVFLPAGSFLAFLADMPKANLPFTLLAALFMIGTMGVGTLVVSELIHQRPFRSIFGPAGPALHQFWRVARIAALLSAASALISLAGGGEVSAGMPLGNWLMLLPLTLLALLIQTGAEEVVFRGYFQSQLAARFSHPAVWLIVPSLVFTFLHYQPDTFGSNALPYLALIFLFALSAADLTARSGTLGPAIALHFVNNAFSLALFSFEDHMSGLALWNLPFGPDSEHLLLTDLPAEALLILIYWLAARLALRV